MSERDIVERLKNSRVYADEGHHNLFDTAIAELTALRQRVKELEGERDERDKLSRALRAKDEAMGVLFKRLADAGVDVSDLIP